LSRTQHVLAAYVRSLTFAWTYGADAVTPTILCGISASVVVLPAIILECASADHEDVARFTGNWLCDAAVIVRENADDCTEDEHLAHAGEVFDAFIASDVATLLNATAAGVLTVNDVVTPARQGYTINNRSWQSTLTFRVLASYD